MAIDLKQIGAGLAGDAKAAALVGIREVLTEENSDKLIARLMEILKPKLPVWARWLPLGKVLDALLPGALLKVMEEALS